MGRFLIGWWSWLEPIRIRFFFFFFFCFFLFCFFSTFRAPFVSFPRQRQRCHSMAADRFRIGRADPGSTNQDPSFSIRVAKRTTDRGIWNEITFSCHQKPPEAFFFVFFLFFFWVPWLHFRENQSELDLVASSSSRNGFNFKKKKRNE